MFVMGRNDILASFFKHLGFADFPMMRGLYILPGHAGARNKCETVFGLLTTTAILSLNSQILFGREHLLQYFRPPP